MPRMAFGGPQCHRAQLRRMGMCESQKKKKNRSRRRNLREYGGKNFNTEIIKKRDVINIIQICVYLQMQSDQGTRRQ